MLISLNNYIELLEKQSKLDLEIMKRIDKIENSNLIYKRRFALLTEIVEFANEVKWFKYWSKKNSDTQKVKEELIDVIHFALSIAQKYIIDNNIGIEEFYNSISNSKKKIDKDNIGQLFFSFINLASVPETSIIKIWEYIDMFNKYVFGNETELLKVYDIKNKINHKRQITNY